MIGQMELLNAAAAKTQEGLRPAFNIDLSQTKTLETALQNIFPTKQEESKVERARRILGEVAIDFSDEELENNVTQFQSLIDAWLDSYERAVFENKTLSQLIGEGQR